MCLRFYDTCVSASVMDTAYIVPFENISFPY